ncbi:Uveal autoantigen with coiled-coil/ankyrin [Citrus sinensis]|uniref:Uveal autoantigen with coiled-coil/ankyrin n=1 Tax=Citrus sinensis TaxID=2711 RepID=A0ACB8I8N1_CITSI|nr:Uveal autoantigen with coiled-coil/ankyrin [Citrus sinensis]
MANVESDSTPSVPELNESRAELLNRIQGLKQDLQNWRSKLDTQVKIYRDELTDMKKTLSVEVEQLRSLQDFSGDDKERKDDPNINGKDEEVHAIATPVEDNAKADDK